MTDISVRLIDCHFVYLIDGNKDTNELLNFSNIEFHKLLLIMSNIDKKNSDYIHNFSIHSISVDISIKKIQKIPSFYKLLLYCIS